MGDGEHTEARPLPAAARFEAKIADGQIADGQIEDGQTEDGALAGLRWARADKPPLLYCHATGFCASAYKQMLQILSADFDVYALDMRGHGRTALPADPPALRSWDVYAGDVAAFLDREDRRDWTLAGHSMGAVTAALAARGRDDIRALKLIEPVAPPPVFAFAAKTPLWPLLSRRIPLVAQAARRRAAWPDRAAVAENYAGKALFRNWAEGVLADYLEDGLTQTAEGVRLSCDPAWEAATFAAQANDFWGAVRRAPAPVSVLVADHPTTTAGSGARRRLRRFGAVVTATAAASHLAPLEKPGFAAQFVAGADL